MANVPLKSVKFPGLDDTYTVPQIDANLTASGKAADAKVTGDSFNEFVEVAATASSEKVHILVSPTSSTVDLATQDEVDGIKDDLAFVSHDIYGLGAYRLEQGSVNTNTGNISDNANYVRTSKCAITPSTAYILKITNNEASTIGSAVVYYKADGTYLSANTSAGSVPAGKTVEKNITSPENAYFMRVRFNLSPAAALTPSDIGLEILSNYAWKKQINDEIDTIDGEITALNSKTLFNYGNITTAGLDLNSGDFIHPGMWTIVDLAMIPYHYPSARIGLIISFTSSTNNTIYTYQVVIDNANITYRRFSTTTSVWSPWVCDNPYNKLSYKPSDPVCTFEASKHTQADTGNYTMIWGSYENRVSRLIGMYDAETNPHGYSINKSSLGKDATNTFDVWLYKVSLGYTNQSNKPVVLLVVGEHGNEPASAMTGYYAYHEILDGTLSKYLTYVDFWVVPLMNPYGYEHNTRNNENDVNLNRDFPANWNYSTDLHNKTDNYSMSQPETNYIINLCLQNRNRILFVCNKHDTGAIGRKIAQNEVDTVGYLTTCLYTDSVINESICKFEDQQVKETDPYIITACSADLSHKQLIVNNSPHPLNGSLDLFLNSIGIHASLLEGSYSWNDGTNVYYDATEYTNPNYATSQIRYITDFLVNYLAWTIQHSEYLQSSDRAFDDYTLKSRKYNESTGEWEDITLWYNGTSVVEIL